MSFWNLFSKKEPTEPDKKSTGTITAPTQTADELFELGKRYLNKDDAQAFSCFLKAAEIGHVKSMRNVGVCYWSAKGIGFDIEKAVYWYKKAAEHGNAPAMKDLANFYLAGIVVEKSEETAKEWLKKAAEGGDDKAATTLHDFEQLKDLLAERLLHVVEERTADINAN